MKTKVNLNVHIKHLGTTYRQYLSNKKAPYPEYEITITVPEGERYDDFDLTTMKADIPAKDIKTIGKYNAVVVTTIEGGISSNTNLILWLKKVLALVEGWLLFNKQPNDNYFANIGKLTID